VTGKKTLDALSTSRTSSLNSKGRGKKLSSIEYNIRTRKTYNKIERFKSFHTQNAVKKRFFS